MGRQRAAHRRELRAASGLLSRDASVSEYLLQNSADAEARVRVRFLRPNDPPLEKSYVLAPTSRTNIFVKNEEFPGVGRALASTDVSGQIDVTSGPPIVVERATYWGPGWQAGTNALAVRVR